MSLNLIAILLSLAMMLTGAGGEGQPAEASRNLVLHNVAVSYNGETLRLGPQARLGVSTDGAKAVFDFGVDLNDETLLPVQLGVSDAGVTALFANSDVAVTATAEALKGLEEQLNEAMEGAVGAMQGEESDLMNFIIDEYLPAYTAVLNAAMDNEMQNEIKASGMAVFNKMVQRGDGTPANIQVEGESYEATAYRYTLESDQLAELCDALYNSSPILSDYYNATFKLYGMLPDESGLTDIHSYADLFEKTNLSMRMDIDEKLAEDGDIDIIDAVLTIDMTAIEAEEPEEIEEDVEGEVEEAPAEEAAEDDDEDVLGGPEPEGDAPDAPEPLVINIHSAQIGDAGEAQVSFAHDVDDDQSLEFNITATQEIGVQDVEMDLSVIEGGRKTQRAKASLFFAQDDQGGSSYSVSVRHIAQDTSKVDATFYGMCNADGTSENSFTLGVRTEDYNAGLSFDLDVTADPITDAVNGHESAYVIDDLSEEGLEAIGSDQTFSGLMMKVMGSMTVDGAKLTGDRGIKGLMTLMDDGRLPIDVEDLDEEDYDYTYEVTGDGDDEYAYVIDGEETEVGYDDEPVEDDGVLGFEQPELTWLPAGWTVSSVDADTAYDWVEMAIVNDKGEEVMYAVFFADPEAGSTNYIVAEDGGIVSGREINVTDFGGGSLSVTVREGGLYGNMMFTSEAIDVETIGKIVAGIQF